MSNRRTRAPIHRRSTRAGAAGRGELFEPKSEVALAGLPYWSSTLKAGDANWNLVVVPAKGGLITFYRAWLVLAAVILVFGAVLAYMWSSVRYALRLETANGRILEAGADRPPHQPCQPPRFHQAAHHGVHRELARRTALCRALSRHR
jgi:hypothetical protein